MTAQFDPEKHHRRSIRLKGYDYTQPGGYFVTVVTQGRKLIFGKIRNEEMILNSAGEMVVKWWLELPNKFPPVSVGTFVVMPNHFHGIILIEETVGADLRVCPDDKERVCPDDKERVCPDDDENTKQGEHTGSPQRTGPNASLSQIVQWFKTMTTNEYIRGVKQLGWEPFIGKLWQRNYYEHIIRDHTDWDRIHRYIESNTATWADDEENPDAHG
jgi:putative transposase